MAGRVLSGAVLSAEDEERMVIVCAVPALHETVQSQHCALYGHYVSEMAQWSAGAIAAYH